MRIVYHTQGGTVYTTSFSYPNIEGKEIYGKIRSDIGKILRQLCMYKDWAKGYYVSTVGLNRATIEKYIKEQQNDDLMLDKQSVKEYEDPFKGR